MKIFLPEGYDTRVNRVLLIIIFLWLRVITAYAEDQRIWLSDVKINGQPARFIFDTGAGGLLIMRDTAERLGLKVIKPSPPYRPPPGLVAVGWTEKCRLTLGDTTIKTRLVWGEFPKGVNLEFDGTIDWPSVNKRIFSIDAAKQSVKFLDQVPNEAASWTKLRVQANSSLLNLEIPGTDGKTAIIYLDTGDIFGVTLNPQKWTEWKAAHTNQPMTLEAGYTGPLGFFAAEETWAHEITLGPLKITEVPVHGIYFPKPASASESRARPMFTLGLAAMSRLDIVIDGKHNLAYLRPKTTPPLPYTYNRLGAGFVPLGLKSDDLVACVVDGSPAYEAGIRNGDILLKIDEQDVTKWRTSGKPNHPFREQPVGTRLQLTLKRGDKIFTTTAVLQDILATDATKPPN